MKKRLFIYTTIVLIAGLLGFLGVSVFITSRNNISIASSTVTETARISAGLFHNGVDLREFVNVGEDTRITVVSADGTVLADSFPAGISPVENHLYRPEIIAAAAGTPAVQIRYSTTHNANFIYYALQVPADDSYVFIRAAIPVAQIDAYLLRSLPLLILLLLVLAVISFTVIRDVSNRILAPFSSIENNLRLLSRGEYKQEPIPGSFEEIEKITREIDEIAIFLQKNYDALRDEKNKLAYILNSIGDGLFVVDENERITLLNLAACGIFGASPDVNGNKLNYLVSDKQLAGSISDCVENSKNALFEYTFGEKIYLVTIKRLPDTKLTMTALSDITESRENAKRREEFFANASHELKTPLTAIRGFNELASLRNKDEGMEKYLEGIARETNRMMLLITGMLRLSELETTKKTEPVSMSLAAVVNEVRDVVSPAIGEKGLFFEASGDATVFSEPEHIYETVKNLIENAVRYTNYGGKITVTIETAKKRPRLTVSDTGIGISTLEQTKIFERFYRVEKSRSVQSGGTGLGLSIVKHTCALYGWRLSLKSKPGIGTEVSIEFYCPLATNNI